AVESVLAEEFREISQRARLIGCHRWTANQGFKDGNWISLDWPGHDDGESTYKCDARPQRPGAPGVPTPFLGAERIGTVCVGTGRALEDAEFDQSPYADRQGDQSGQP